MIKISYFSEGSIKAACPAVPGLHPMNYRQRILRFPLRKVRPRRSPVVVLHELLPAFLTVLNEIFAPWVIGFSSACIHPINRLATQVDKFFIQVFLRDLHSSWRDARRRRNNRMTHNHIFEMVTCCAGNFCRSLDTCTCREPRGLQSKISTLTVIITYIIIPPHNIFDQFAF